jgi:hypothetical protein
MTSQFTAEEWAAVAAAPLHAAARVVAADRGGTMREKLSVRSVYAAARELRGESPLLDALVASPPSLDLDPLLAGADPAGSNTVRVQAGIAAVRAKASPEDADAYRGFVLAVVQTVAEANREGGFAGIGGEEVSAGEQAALDEITAVLEG